MSELCNMLTWRRPERSWSELGFIDTYVDSLPGDVVADGYGNRILDVGDAPRVLWSAHTDSVHARPGFQPLAVQGDVVRLKQPASSHCLGADCATGVYILRRLVLAGVPGRYVFHRDEETGCNGADYIRRETPELLDGIDYAIAFDRRGYDSVVTRQAGRRTCSDAFAAALADGLGLGMAPDPTGVWTDTERYAEHVPECTNVSVGYAHAHTSRECQDMAFADAVIRAVARLDVAGLPVVRDPAPDVWPELLDYGATDGTWRDHTYDDECGVCGCPLEPWDYTATFDGVEVCEVCTGRLVQRGDPYADDDDAEVIPIRKAR